jgi:hypothetical protein
LDIKIGVLKKVKMKAVVLFLGRIYLNGGFLITFVKKQFSHLAEMSRWIRQNFRRSEIEYPSLGWDDISVGRMLNFQLSDWNFSALHYKNELKSSNHHSRISIAIKEFSTKTKTKIKFKINYD